MSKNRDYTRYSKGANETVETVNTFDPGCSEEPIVEDAYVEMPVVEEKVEESKPIIGVVANCSKLNVRENPYPTADVLGVINADTELIISEAESNKEFYKICTASGLEGYCMKKFVTIMP